MPRWIKTVFFIIAAIFALIGLLFTTVFIAMQFNLLNVRGSSMERNSFFTTGLNWQKGGAGPAAVATPIESQPCADKAVKACSWNETPEWAVVKGGLEKDSGVIARVAKETGVSPRLIAAVVIPEQIRFFTSEREVFKRYFEPLKILGSLSQFSLGVSGIKQETANQIEQYASDTTSPFYPGPEAATLLAYPAGTNHDSALYARLTDPKDHYYSYLYTALYIKEVLAQWRAAGFDISTNAAAVVTLFNIGFQSSHPNASPQPAGAAITTGGQVYPFGVLGGLFYQSSELESILPR
ncbi:MAG: hypothetical protein AAB883_01805 [Patescibacteria group bacterium]